MCIKLSEKLIHADHIISIKHGGPTNIENLAYSCSACNQNKGTDLGTYLPNGKKLIRFFNPRKDKWNQHFEIYEGEIVAKTKIGEASAKIFQFNVVDRVILRKLLMEMGRYP